ncbi:MAG: radical SAM protein [Candidatus Woesearchaeota archaeon]|jgi:radical SAM superfamily enzyme YgiQ (UPF0313 family)
MKQIHLIEAVDPGINVREFELKSFGLGYLVSYAKKYGSYDNFSITTSGPDIKFNNEIPDIIGITSVTQNFEIAKKLIRNIRRRYKKMIIIVGGVHVSALPFSTPKEVDYIVVGEGEQTFLELLDFLIKKKNKIENIKGIYYKKDNEFVFTGPREMIKNLDNIPMPRRSKEEIKQTQHMRLFTSRGCPYRCPYCSASHYWKNIRFNSAEYVLKELELLINKYRAKEISFGDDLFIGNKPRLEAIAKEIIKKGWHKKVAFSVLGRANLIDEKTVKLLKSMNVKVIFLGLESGSPRMLKIMKNSTVTIQQNYEAVQLIKREGIRPEGYFMFGYPGETVKDIDATIDFIKKTNIGNIGFAITMPFPGTKLWDDALKKGIVSENMDWNLFQTDFTQDINHALIISDIDRKILFRKYKEFLEITLRKNLETSTTLAGYLNRLNFKYITKLLRNPEKIIFGFKVLSIILVNRLLKVLHFKKKA